MRAILTGTVILALAVFAGCSKPAPEPVSGQATPPPPDDAQVGGGPDAQTVDEGLEDHGDEAENAEEAEAALVQGNSLFEDGELEGALDAYGRAIELMPQWPEGWLGRGGTYRSLGSKLLIDDEEAAGEYLRQAIDDFTQATDLDPKEFLGYVGLARCYWHLGEYEKAVENFDIALELNPDDDKIRQMRDECAQDLEVWQG